MVRHVLNSRYQDIMMSCVQCIPLSQKCDFMAQCVSASDEQMCFKQRTKLSDFGPTPPPPSMVTMDRRGLLMLEPLEVSTGPKNRSCPLTHFECPGLTYYCLPVFLRCNGVRDCPGHEDELHCDDYQCPGYYRCRNSRICVHAEHVCDGLYGQCPQNDDELLCGFTCPPGCQCFGMAFFCSRSVSVGQYPELRYLSADESNMTLKEVENNTMLVHLSLALCLLEDAKVPHLPNLLSLDLGDNLLTSVGPGSFVEVKSLRELTLAGNPLSFDKVLPALTERTTLRVLDLSRVHISEIDPRSLEKLVHLHTLNLSHTNLGKVLGSGFQNFTSLWTLDLDNCPLIHFPRTLFEGLTELAHVASSNYKVCCPTVLPEDFNPNNCKAWPDAVSSCTSLLRSNVYKVIVSGLAILSLVGNLTSLLYWSHTCQHGFSVFLKNLWVSGFVKGVYCMIIGVADFLYLGSYHLIDLTWRRSVYCRTAGFLSLLSAEASVFCVCLLTLDRFLILHVPFSRLHFSPKSAKIASVNMWVTAACVSVIPLLPMTSHWDFYGRTALCLPLPVDGKYDMAHIFLHCVFHILNSILFLLVSVEQTAISWSVTTKIVVVTDESQQLQDLLIARRLIAIAMIGFLAWFSVGVLGFLAVKGYYVSNEVKVVLATLVLPFDATLNPLLYTFNVVQERRRKEQEKQLLAILSRLSVIKH